MAEYKQHIDLQKLTEKYLSNQASTEEKELLLDRISEDTSARVEFHKIKREFFDSKEAVNSSLFDEDAAFDSFQNKILVQDKQKNRNIFISICTLAASILLIFSIWFINSSPAPEMEMVATLDNKHETDLSDGSSVVLNKNTKLSFPKQFSDDYRRVDLKGEAFFDVAHNPEKPFLVKAGDVEVTVLGTSFNINMTDTACIVTVKTGKVKVTSVKYQTECIITEGEFATVPFNKIPFDSGNNKDHNYLTWETGQIVFEDATPAEVARVIKKQYGVEFKYSDQMDSCLLNTKFNNDSLETIIKTIEITFGAKSKNEDNTIIFAGQGC